MRLEPPPGADPGHPPYEGGAAAVRGGVATGAGIEPACSRFRALAGCQQPTRYRTGGGSRTRNRRGLGSPPLRWATPACAAKGSNFVPRGKSPVHHQSCLQRLERTRGIEPRSGAWKASALPLSYIRPVAPAGSDPASPGFQPDANPSQLESRGREAGTRTPSAWSQARRANPYATSRGRR